MRIQQEACAQMYGIKYVRARALVKIVQLTNHVLVHELALVVQGRVEVVKKQSLETHGNGICSGYGTKTDIFYDLLCKRGLSELIQSVPLFLGFYSYVVGSVSLVL